MNPLQESREGHKKPQGGKRVTSVPIGDNAEREIIAELRRRWQAGDFRGEKLRVPGGITPDLDRTLATYFERKRLSEVERSDLARIAAQVGISPLLFGVVN